MPAPSPISVRADRSAVVEVLEDLQTLLDDGMRLLALDVDDEADARIVFLGRVIQTAGSEGLDLFGGTRVLRRPGSWRTRNDNGKNRANLPQLQQTTQAKQKGSDSLNPDPTNPSKNN